MKVSQQFHSFNQMEENNNGIGWWLNESGWVEKSLDVLLFELQSAAHKKFIQFKNCCKHCSKQNLNPSTHQYY
jgi:hypothetical protein